MWWKGSGVFAIFVFCALGAVHFYSDYPYLWLIAYFGAAGLGVPLARGKFVPSWATIAVVVFTTEMLLISYFYPGTPQFENLPTEPVISERLFENFGAFLVVAWATAIAVFHPFSDGDPDKTMLW